MNFFNGRRIQNLFRSDGRLKETICSSITFHAKIVKYVSVKLGLFHKISRDDFETPLTQPFVYTAIQLYSSGNFEHIRFRFCVALLTGGSVGIFMFSLPLFPQYHCFSIPHTHCILIFFLFQMISYPVLSYDFAQEMSSSIKPHK